MGRRSCDGINDEPREMDPTGTVAGPVIRVLPQNLIRADSRGSENRIMIAGDASASHISCLFRPKSASIGGSDRSREHRAPAPTRCASAKGAKDTSQAVRPSVAGFSVPALPFGSECNRYRSPGDRCALAPRRLSCVLALEIEKPRRATKS